jgi:hypothetical protein
VQKESEMNIRRAITGIAIGVVAVAGVVAVVVAVLLLLLFAGGLGQWG